MLEATERIELAAAQSKPRCQSQCGDVTIPYPFGTGRDCNISEDFFVTCDKSSTPNKAFLTDSTIEVVNISLHGQLRVLGSPSYDCYPKGPNSYFNYWITLAKFPVDNSRNKFTAIGCDTNTVVSGSNIEYATGCLSLCNSITDVINGSCSGIGCCQTAIPKGVRGYNITLDSYQSHTNVLPDNPCSYAFVAEDGAYNFSNSDLLGYGLKDKEFLLKITSCLGSCCLPQQGVAILSKLKLLDKQLAHAKRRNKTLKMAEGTGKEISAS